MLNQIRSAQWTVQKNKNKNNIKVTQHKSIYMVRNKSKMCNGIKSAKTVYCDLINSNMNKRDVANGLYRVCTHSSNTGDENMMFYSKQWVL